jgi:hypothetical protein
VTGGCLCGAVRFELSEPPTDAGYCHCTRCQGRTGGGSSLQARIEGETFRFVAGEEHVQCWQPDAGFAKCFCRECGAHLFSHNDDWSKVSVRLAAFDEDPGVRPQWRAFTNYAAPWEPIPDDGLPRYPEAKPRD